MAPFAFPTRAVASLLWYALSVALLYLFLRQSLRLLPERRVRAGWLVVLVVLCTGKFWVKELAFGQTNVLLAVVLTGALAAAERGRWRVAGVLIGVATFVKPYALLLFPWLAVVGGLESAAIAGGIVVAGLLAPAITYGWQANLTRGRGLVSHGQRHHGAQSARRREHLVRDDVGEVARPGRAGIEAGARHRPRRAGVCSRRLRAQTAGVTPALSRIRPADAARAAALAAGLGLRAAHRGAGVLSALRSVAVGRRGRGRRRRSAPSSS